jgi:hypothetical protein
MPTFAPITSVSDGPRLEVNDLIGDPSVVPRRIIDVMKQRFLADQLLRGGPSAKSGVVKFYQSNPLFSSTLSEYVAEFGEIPVSTNDLGTLMVTPALKRALGVRISREMADENDMDAVNLQINQVQNRMVKDWNGAFIAAVLAAVAVTGQTIAAANAWNTTNGNPRTDIFQARGLIVNALLPNTTDNYLLFNPDTLVLSMLDVQVMLENDNIWQAWLGGNIANLNPQVTGKLPDQIFGLDAWATWDLPQGTALVIERNTVGFISDERPLQATPLFYHENTESWRSNVVRKSAVGIDQPYAAATITGIG